MSKQHNAKLIRTLAYCHRYGWVVVILILTRFFNPWLVVSTGSMCYALWTFIGYKMRWEHIYCSFQNAYHLPMTPGKADWKKVRKFDVYALTGTFMVLGLLSFLICLHPEWGKIKIHVG